MIDPMVSLAFAVHSNKGAHALLLGSGVSRASGIPTGWEVVIDLIRKVAALEGEDCTGEPADWFRRTRGEEPDYSKLLDAIAKTPTERQQLLRGYFEPTAEERSQGLKLPTKAHRAIAELVVRGYVRVIVTTNFDRLIERALEDVGVTPAVISTVDQLKGALPLAHSGATVVKLHGDYLDTRIKNTEAELTAYDTALDGLLDRILDEYGLIVSGWSGDWDSALRAAIERCPSRRFATYWSTRSPLSEKGRKLADHRKAVVIQIGGADQLFEGVLERVQSLEDLAAPYPLSPKMAAATVKRYIVDPAAKIRLRDLVHEETEVLARELTSAGSFPGTNSQDHPAELLSRMRRYEGLCEKLASVLITGGYWGEGSHDKLWCGCLQRIVNLPSDGDGLDYLIKLRKYPALLLLYSYGISAIAAGRYESLAALLHGVVVKHQNVNEFLLKRLNTFSIMENPIGHLLPGMERHYVPLSDYLFDHFRSRLVEYLPADGDYQEAFDRFEYIVGVVYAATQKREYKEGWIGPYGCFVWRGRDYGPYLPDVVAKEVEEAGSDWLPAKAGIFGRENDLPREAVVRFGKYLKGLSIN